jgi:hypothetical protein
MDIEEKIKNNVLYFTRSLPDMKYEHQVMYSQLVEKLYRLEYEVESLKKEISLNSKHD